VSDQERMSALFKRIRPDYQSDSDDSLSEYNNRLLEALVVLQLDAHDVMRELKQERNDSRRRLNPDGSSPFNEALADDSEEYERVRGLNDQQIVREAMDSPLQLVRELANRYDLSVEKLTTSDELPEPAAAPDPRIVWPAQDVRRFVFTMDVPLTQLKNQSWGELVFSAMEHYMDNCNVELPAEHFATQYKGRYGDIEVCMNSHSAVLRCRVAEDGAESNVHLPKCAAKPVRMALSMLQEIDGDTVSKARALLQAALIVRDCYADWSSFDSMPPGINIDWQAVADRPWSKDPDQRPISLRSLSPDKYEGSEPVQLGAGVDIERSAGPYEPNNDEVICPRCTHQFRAIPVNVQGQMYALQLENEVAIRFLQEASAFLKAQQPLGLAPDRLAKRIDEWLSTPSARHAKSGDEQLGDDKAAMKREAMEAWNQAAGAWAANIKPTRVVTIPIEPIVIKPPRVIEKEATVVGPDTFHIDITPEDTAIEGPVEFVIPDPNDPGRTFHVQCNVVGKPEGSSGIFIDSDGKIKDITIPLVTPNGTTIDVPTGQRFGVVPPEPRPCGCAMLETAQGLQCQRGGLFCRCPCHDRHEQESPDMIDMRSLLRTVGDEIAAGNLPKARALLTGLLEGIGGGIEKGAES
jgi:hypothetical protein